MVSQAAVFAPTSNTTSQRHSTKNVPKNTAKNTKTAKTGGGGGCDSEAEEILSPTRPQKYFKTQIKLHQPIDQQKSGLNTLAEMHAQQYMNKNSKQASYVLTRNLRQSQSTAVTTSSENPMMKNFQSTIMPTTPLENHRNSIVTTGSTRIAARHSRNLTTTLTPSIDATFQNKTNRSKKRRPPTSITSPLDENRVIQMRSNDLNAKTLVNLGSIW